jgi:hypothetical protein
MSDSQSTLSPIETRARNRRRKLLRKARLEKVARKERIFYHLVRGMPHTAIARFENCSVQHVRQIIARELAIRQIEPAADFVKLQVERLNQALVFVSTQLLDGDAAGVDQLLKVVAELDRYHGLAQAEALGNPGAARGLRAITRSAAPAALPAPMAMIEETTPKQISIASL